MLELIYRFDFAILDFIHNNLSSPIMDGFMVFVTTLGNAGMLWIITAIAMLCSKKYRATGIMLVLGLTVGLILGNIILKPVVARIRPFGIKEGIELIIKAPSDYSFPSGHTLASVISAVIILLRHKKIGYAAMTAAVLIAFSRLYLYVHFPTDVIAGAILGGIVAFFSVKTVNHYLKSDKI